MADNTKLTENITINTHSSVRIAGSKILYFDPFEISEEKADADLIFVTHEHFDHFDVKSIANVKKEGTILVVPESMKKKVEEDAVAGKLQVYYFLPGNEQAIGEIQVEAVAAYNRLKPFHPKGKGWLGYVVTMDGVRYFVAGDTDANEDNKKVKCDVALIPIGGNYTMDKKHAADYIATILPKVAIPTHYGSVVGNVSDGSDFQNAVKNMGIETEVVLKL